MIRFRLRERIADKSFVSGVHVTFCDIASATGIHRATLSKIASGRHCNTTTDNLVRLCQFFGCSLADLVEFVPADTPTASLPAMTQ